MKTVTIIGGGFSGTLVAVLLGRLARSRGLDIAVSLWEQGDGSARGHAYATDCPKHLLNVPAGRMSAFADEPGHFLEWVRARGVPAGPGSFVERRLYGAYLGEILDRGLREARGRLRMTRGRVVDVDATEAVLRIQLADGRTDHADAVVLATGHPLPSPPARFDRAVQESGRFEPNPWSPAATGGLADDSDLLLIGSGLTAVDVLLQARELGFKGTVRVLSRRGLLPLAHGSDPLRPSVDLPTLGPPRVRTMMRALRSEVAEAATRGIDWRVVFDSLRPRTQELWKSLPLVERQRFLRHARPYWEVHRHRVAAPVKAAVESELAAGTLVRHAGRILGIDLEGDRLRVMVRPRGGGAEYALRVQRVVNCTGPNTGIEILDSPLTRSLLAKGLCRADLLGIGLACDADGAVLYGANRPSRRLFTLGPLRKGELWETTAVPELRVQAGLLAGRLAGGGG